MVRERSLCSDRPASNRADHGGATGGTTIEAPGTQQALDRTEEVLVRVGDKEGSVRRPNLFGALVGKAATREILIDPGKGRHVIDVAVLASLLTAADLRGATISKRDGLYLSNMLHVVRSERADQDVEGAQRGLNMLRSALRQRSQPTSY